MNRKVDQTPFRYSRTLKSRIFWTVPGPAGLVKGSLWVETRPGEPSGIPDADMKGFRSSGVNRLLVYAIKRVGISGLTAPCSGRRPPIRPSASACRACCSKPSYFLFRPWSAGCRLFRRPYRSFHTVYQSGGSDLQFFYPGFGQTENREEPSL